MKIFTIIGGLTPSAEERYDVTIKGELNIYGLESTEEKEAVVEYRNCVLKAFIAAQNVDE